MFGVKGQAATIVELADGRIQVTFDPECTEGNVSSSGKSVVTGNVFGSKNIVKDGKALRVGITGSIYVSESK